MNIDELIDAAKRKKGSMSAVAEGLNMNQTRLSDWRAGRRKPDANEIAYLADSAGLPVFETVGMIQMQLDNRFTAIWQTALKKLHGEDHASGWRKR